MLFGSLFADGHENEQDMRHPCNPVQSQSRRQNPVPIIAKYDCIEVVTDNES
jgi:hypothetical protein